MTVAQEFEAANEKYAATFNEGGLPMPPARKVLVVACMDARVDPAKELGLSKGDAHVVRNAGGRGIAAIRDIVISQQLLGTREIVVIHHTDCGMLTFKDHELHAKVKSDLGENADHIAWLSFSDLEKSVAEDVVALKKNPLVLDVPITGYVFDVNTGKLTKVEA
ncbi:putative carbonic anhydrase [Stachybotrys elegans]|uniref:Carbonic anhydrase n=1 Tax=Stachybotrys elegans TaxID=80388 RepID=A0A8K0SH61_9HYPO|nr:putative carbonic anhydrase [Stachybotrys elegans]